MSKLETLYQKIIRRKNHPRSIKRTALIDRVKSFSRVLLIILTITGLTYFLLASNYFQLTQIQIVANQKILTVPEINQLAKIPVGENIFSFSLSDLIRNLKAFPWVNQVQIRRKLPNQLIINIKYHQPIAIIEVNAVDKYLISNEAIIFKKISNQEYYDLPIISGFNREALEDYASFNRPFFFRSFNFLENFLADQKNQSVELLELNFDIINGVEILISDQQDSEKLMTLYYGQQSYQQTQKIWQSFLTILNQQKIWYQEVDFHVQDKIFARFRTDL